MSVQRARTQAGDCSGFNPCIIIPVYNHQHALDGLLAELEIHAAPTWLIDDGSSRDCAAHLDQLTLKYDWVRLDRLPRNQGKGVAMQRGFRLAAAAGFSHALQIDADGQHNPADAASFFAAGRNSPSAIISGQAIFDDSVPRGRLYGRFVTHVWVWINTASLKIKDSMCGYRLYPLKSTITLLDEEPIGERMDFDTDIIVRLFWRGVDVINLPTRVRYPLDGISHFRVLTDNLRISRMHARLFFTMLARRFGLSRKIVRNPAEPRNHKS